VQLLRNIEIHQLRSIQKLQSYAQAPRAADEGEARARGQAGIGVIPEVISQGVSTEAERRRFK